jgi:hypothetical protein
MTARTCMRCSASFSPRDPSWAAQHLNDSVVNALAIVKPLRNMTSGLLRELPAYLAASQGVVINHSEGKEDHQLGVALVGSQRQQVPSVGQSGADVFRIHAQLGCCRACVLVAQDNVR